MNTDFFWGMRRFSGVDKGMILRIGLVTFAVLSSVIVAWTLFSTHRPVRAAGIQANTVTNPDGLALDGKGNIWVAEPGCPTCPSPPAASIGQYSVNGNTLVKNFTAPTGMHPVFLAVDNAGNIWFTDPNPNDNLIGEFVPGTGTWQKFPVPTANAAPFDMMIVNNNIWFTEVRANQIGYFNTVTKKFHETRVPTANAGPYGITVTPSGKAWFTESAPLATMPGKLGTFTPTANGNIAITEHAITNSHPHMLASDSKSNIFFSESFTGNIGEYTTTGQDVEFNVSQNACPPPGQPPCPAVSGIAVDSNGNVAFDDPQSSRLGLFNPNNHTYSVTHLTAGSDPFDGLIVDKNNNIWVTELTSSHLDEFPESSLGSTTNIPPPPGPVNATWYFAEGRVGKGFREYLTVENPGNTACSLTFNYSYVLDGATASSTKVVTTSVGPATRLTESVNTDLGIADSSPSAASLSAVVKAGTCAGVVVERPMYFSSYHGLSSGHDTIGLTHLATTFAFADVPTGPGINTFLTILNPGALTANVKATYYAKGQAVATQTVSVGPNARSTIFPGSISLPSHVAAVVTSTQPIMVERPSYMVNVNGVSGASDVIGATPGNSWLFAEGYAAPNSQETLTIANVEVGNASAAVTITLESKTGAKQTYNITVGARQQMIWNVNNNDNFTGASPEVSAQVTSTGASIVVQREMYLHYSHTLSRGSLSTNSLTDVMGLPSADMKSSYDFAEGYTNLGYNVWLVIQNPNNNAETIYLTLVNGQGHAFVQSYMVPPTSRTTIDITNLMETVGGAGNGPNAILANEVSMTVQTLNNGGSFVVERPEYFNTAGLSPFVVSGATDVYGYMGG